MRAEEAVASKARARVPPTLCKELGVVEAKVETVDASTQTGLEANTQEFWAQLASFEAHAAQLGSSEGRRSKLV